MNKIEGKRASICLSMKEIEAIHGIQRKTGDSESQIVRDAVNFFGNRCNSTPANKPQEHPPFAPGCNYQPPQRRLVRQTEILRMFNISHRYFQKACEEGKIPAHEFGGVLRYDPDEVAEATLVRR